jgi:hypothetical protein
MSRLAWPVFRYCAEGVGNLPHLTSRELNAPRRLDTMSREPRSNGEYSLGVFTDSCKLVRFPVDKFRTGLPANDDGLRHSGWHEAINVSVQGEPIDSMKVDVPESDRRDVSKNCIGRDIPASSTTALHGLV